MLACHDCGSTDRVQQLPRRGFEPIQLCADCAEGHTAPLIAGEFLVLVAVIQVFAIIAIVRSSTASWNILPTFYVVALVGAVLQVALHELAHWGVGRAVGYECPNVVVGAGTRLLDFTVGGTRFEWRMWPVKGVTSLRRTSPTRPAWHGQAATYLAGPAINIATLVALLSPTVRHDVYAAALAAGAFTGALSILPIPGESAASRGSDGMQTLRAMFRGANAEMFVDITGQPVSRGWLLAETRNALSLSVANRHADAVLAWRALLARGLKSAPVRLYLAIALCGLRRYPEAIDEARLALWAPSAEKYLPEIRNVLAWSLLMQGDEAQLETAVTLAEAAYEQAPGSSAMAGTLALARVKQGAWQEARALCEQAWAGAEGALERATVAATFALAYLGLGRLEDARQSARQARELAPDCELLPMLDAAFGLT